MDVPNGFETSEDSIQKLLGIINELNTLKDVDTILDKILTEARNFSCASAGSIFLVEDTGRLVFSHVQNDSLFRRDETHKSVYSNFSLPINDKSMAGYTALTGEPLEIEDAYELPAGMPFDFDSSWDEKTGFRTGSVLCIPLKTHQDRLVGVMQILNAKDDDGNVVPFCGDAKRYVSLFANTAAQHIERGLMTREIILRMMKMAEMRDPKETGAHVQRVGAYSAEIYQKWAWRHGVDPGTIKHQKDLIRLAAMLHDVGKVGISDTILKKPARLTTEEFTIMKMHTIYGARLFQGKTSELDRMCYEIALRHHERWVGGGYPGIVDDIENCISASGEPCSGETIPPAGRIVALADVFDALNSKRSYKDPWPEERVLEVIQQESGKHFDPEVVEAFFDIYDVIKAIGEKYRDEDEDLEPGR